MAPFDTARTTFYYSSVGTMSTVSEISPIVYEGRTYVTKSDLEVSFLSNTTVELLNVNVVAQL